MKNIIIILIVVLICCKENQNEEFPLCDYPPIPYVVLYKNKIKTKDNKYLIGIIKYKNIGKDSVSNYCSLFQSVVKICKIEGLSYAEFYQDYSESNDTVGILGERTGKHGNYYLGKIDLTKYGIKWREKICEKDFQYYNPHNIPTRIKPRLPALN